MSLVYHYNFLSHVNGSKLQYCWNRKDYTSIVLLYLLYYYIITGVTDAVSGLRCDSTLSMQQQRQQQQQQQQQRQQKILPTDQL